MLTRLSLAIPFIALATLAGAAETVRLTDGRELVLKENGRYEWPETDRSILLSLVASGQPQDFMSDARDCGLTFEIENGLDGTLLALDANLEILDESGTPLLQEGIMAYEIDLAILEEADLPAGSSARYTVDVQTGCDGISRIGLGNVEERFCNYVGRRPHETCRDLIRVESRAKDIEFSK